MDGTMTSAHGRKAGPFLMGLVTDSRWLSLALLHHWGDIGRCVLFAAVAALACSCGKPESPRKTGGETAEATDPVSPEETLAASHARTTAATPWAQVTGDVNALPERPPVPATAHYTLSPNGRWVARQTWIGEWTLTELATGRSHVISIRKGNESALDRLRQKHSHVAFRGSLEKAVWSPCSRFLAVAGPTGPLIVPIDPPDFSPVQDILSPISGNGTAGARTGQPPRIGSGPIAGMLWSPDSRALAWRRQSGNTYYVTILRTHKTFPVGDAVVAFSPDGKWLANWKVGADRSQINHAYFRITPLGGGTTRRVFRAAPPQSDGCWMCWLPDSSGVLVNAQPPEKSPCTVLVRTDADSKLITLPAAPRPVVTPDGRYAFFDQGNPALAARTQALLQDPTADPAAQGLDGSNDKYPGPQSVRIDLRTGQRTTVPFGCSSISPDGKWIVCLGTGSIVSTETLEKVAVHSDLVIRSAKSLRTNPEWSPDGNWFVVVRIRDDNQESVEFHAVPGGDDSTRPELR